MNHLLYQWEFQDPKMEVLYNMRPYFEDSPLYKPEKQALSMLVPPINRFLLHGHWLYT